MPMVMNKKSLKHLQYQTFTFQAPHKVNIQHILKSVGNNRLGVMVLKRHLQQYFKTLD